MPEAGNTMRDQILATPDALKAQFVEMERAVRLVLSTPDLSVRDAWSSGLARPVAVAPAGDRGLYVLDAGLDRVLRFDPFGVADAAFDGRLAPPDGFDNRELEIVV